MKNKKSFKKNHKENVKQIHKALKKHSPEATKKAKKIFEFKYPKLLILGLSIIFAYFLFSNSLTIEYIKNLGNLSYLGIFIAGMLLAIGFSAAFAVGFFIILQPENIFLATFIGGLGALLSDMLIFKFIKFSFMDEFENLRKTIVIKKVRKIINKSFGIKIKHYLIYVFAGFLIASPLPDEVGVSMLAGLTRIKQKTLAIISFILHSLAIFLIIKIGFIF